MLSGRLTRRLDTCDPGRSASMLRGSSMIFISRVFVLASALRCRFIARYWASTCTEHDVIVGDVSVEVRNFKLMCQVMTTIWMTIDHHG